MEELTKKEVLVEIVTDYICPWCYIGKQKLGMAIEELKDTHNVNLKFVPFELNPDQPVEGMNRKEYRSRKFGSWEKSVMMDKDVTNAGRAVGLNFNYDKVELTPNTFKAHLLTAFAAKSNKHQPISTALFKAYFTEGKDIGSEDILLEIAEQNGLDRESVKEIFQSDDLRKDLKDEEKIYQSRGVRSVPLFIINSKAVSGAQPIETLKEFILSNSKE